MSLPDILEVAGRHAERDLIGAAMRCRQPYRLAPVMAVIDEQAFSDPALRALWGAIRWYWQKHRRVPTPEELYQRVRTDGFVDRGGGWAMIERLLTSHEHDGALEWAALDLIAAHRRSVIRGRLLRAAMALEGMTVPQHVAETLERLSVEMRDAASAIRQLEAHLHNLPRNLMRLTDEILQRLASRGGHQ